jgi:hypothetical protein
MLLSHPPQGTDAELIDGARVVFPDRIATASVRV